jgi:hypothetical protein
LTDGPQLKEAIAAAPVDCQVEIRLPRRGNQRERTARFNVHRLSAELGPPTRARGASPVRLGWVLIEEVDGGPTAVRWLLATTLPLESSDDALRVVGYYTHRWLIELFHFTLKSGCLVEDHQFESMENVHRALACLSIVAWRLLWLTMLARESPDLPATRVLAEPECEALVAVARTRLKQRVPDGPPTLGQAVRWIGMLGGHLGRKGDGPPGVKTLWRGLSRLSDMTVGWLASRAPPEVVVAAEQEAAAEDAAGMEEAARDSPS